MDYNTICVIVGDLYLKSQQQIDAVRTEANQLVATLQEQLEEKEKLVQSLEAEFQRIRKQKDEK